MQKKNYASVQTTKWTGSFKNCTLPGTLFDPKPINKASYAHTSLNPQKIRCSVTNKTAILRTSYQQGTIIIEEY